MSVWGEGETQYFYNLTPDIVLRHIEQAISVTCTGRCLALHSMEKRVYEVEILVDDPRHPWDRFVVVKFYRPGRWHRQQLEEEHQLIQDLAESELPVVAPLADKEGNTLWQIDDLDIFYGIFPKVAGRAPSELDFKSIEWVGRLLGRMHGVGALSKMSHRLTLSPLTYGRENLEYLEAENIGGELGKRYVDLAYNVVDLVDARMQGVEAIRLHGDAHSGNLLWSQDGPFWVDFDDCLMGPPVQDMWLIVGGRDQHARETLSHLLSGYETMYRFDRTTLGLIEPLRSLRMIHFCSWIARRRKDPAFIRNFPHFHQDNYWISQIADLEEQRRCLTGIDPWQ